MQAQHGLLLLRLRRHRPHSRLLHGRPDGARIRRIGLVGLHEGANELRMQQNDIVAQRLDLACPPVRATAGLQRNSRWGLPAEVLDQIVTPESTIDDLSRLVVDPVHLEHALCDIQTVRRGMHLRTSVRKWWQ